MRLRDQSKAALIRQIHALQLANAVLETEKEKIKEELADIARSAAIDMASEQKCAELLSELTKAHTELQERYDELMVKYRLATDTKTRMGQEIEELNADRNNWRSECNELNTQLEQLQHDLREQARLAGVISTMRSPKPFRHIPPVFKHTAS